MTQADPFEGPKLKVERARKHIRDYRAVRAGLNDADIVQIRPEKD
jgi:hypothetical protein